MATRKGMGGETGKRALRGNSPLEWAEKRARKTLRENFQLVQKQIRKEGRIEGREETPAALTKGSRRGSYKRWN